MVEEAQRRGGVPVVLVLGRLLRLRLQQQSALEPDLLSVLGGHPHEAGEVVEFRAQIGVEEGVVPFAPAPEDVVFLFV